MNYKDYFIIPSERYSQYVFVYFPIKKKEFYCDKNTAQSFSNAFNLKDNTEFEKDVAEMLDHISAVRNFRVPNRNINEHPNHALLILSERCNLACEYCYAENAHSNDIISREVLTNTIDYVLSNGGDKFSFSLIGGGEPFFEWDLIVFLVEYIEKTKCNKNVKINITTNLTILDDEKILFLKNHKIGINASFEILEDVQNLQRGFPNKKIKSFTIVDNNIRKLLEADIRVSIRSTITSRNVDRMEEMVEYVRNNYPKIRSLHFEHVSSRNNNNDYYTRFIDSFVRARKLALSYDIKLKNSVLNSIYTLRENFCPGEMTLVPSGEISACHRVSAANDIGYDSLIYGFVDESGLRIDEARLNVARQMMAHHLERCSDCFARYGCAGGCTYNKNNYSEQEMDAYCDFVKRFYVRFFEEEYIKES